MYISIKYAKARVILDGEPTIVIKGQIMEKELKKLRLNIDDLTMLLRTNNTFSIMDVEYAILEPNGDLSIIKKSGKDYVTKEELSIITPKIIRNTLQEYNIDYDWLLIKLNNQGIEKVTDVLYAELQKDGNLYIQKKQQ